MKYTELNVSYDKPHIWKKPTIKKLPKKAKKYIDYVEEEDAFQELKKGAEKEICGNVQKHIKMSKDKNELNQHIDSVMEFYGKAVIATDELEPKFLLNKTNRNTLTKKLQGWCRNLNFNIPRIIDSLPYNDLVGKFVDVPAFVCLAGPSLKYNAGLLEKAKGKSLIIAVDTSLRPLLEMGIVPDICVTHDANPNGCKFFLSKDHELNKQNAQLNDMSDQDIAQVYLALEKDKERLAFKYDTIGLFVNYCHPLTLLAWNGSSMRYYGVLDPSLPVYDTMAACSNYKMVDGKLTPDNKGRVVGGSSVGHVAVYIAIALGCNPVSFLGLDLSYPGGKTYVEGASNQKKVNPNSLVEVDNLSDKKVKTNLSMLSYKMVFEQALPHILGQKPSLRMYNCTEDNNGNPAGILEVGAQPKPLAWVIDNDCNKEVDIKWNIENLKANSLPLKT